MFSVPAEEGSHLDLIILVPDFHIAGGGEGGRYAGAWGQSAR